MIKLTKTMLDKSIIDCNAACRAIALQVGVDFETMAPGDRAIVPAKFWDLTTDSEIRFYRTNNARGDRRISIKGLKQKANIGNTVLLHVSAGEILIEVQS